MRGTQHDDGRMEHNNNRTEGIAFTYPAVEIYWARDAGVCLEDLKLVVACCCTVLVVVVVVGWLADCPFVAREMGCKMRPKGPLFPAAPNEF